MDVVRRVLVGAAIVSASFLIGNRIPDGEFLRALAGVTAFASAIPHTRPSRRE